jgi:putative oxidoreductase
LILRRLARPLLAATFIYGGIGALRRTERYAEVAKPLVDKLPVTVSTDPATLVRLDAAVKIVAGTTLALGKFPRLSALALIGGLLPSTVAGHPFWEAEDDKETQQELIHFLKNAGLVGGLLLAAADTEGKPSLGWRARRAAAKAGKRVHETAEAARDKLPG